MRQTACMTVAIGTDLVDVARLEDRLAASPTLAARVLTARERRACQGRPASVAARWASSNRNTSYGKFG